MIIDKVLANFTSNEAVPHKSGRGNLRIKHVTEQEVTLSHQGFSLKLKPFSLIAQIKILGYPSTLSPALQLLLYFSEKNL